MLLQHHGGYWNKSQHRKLTWRRKFSCHSCPDPNLRPFDHESSTLTTELSLLPIFVPYTLMLHSFPFSALFIRHMHAQTPMLQPLNPWFLHFLTFQSPYLDQSPLSHQSIYDGGKEPPPNSELLTNMAMNSLQIRPPGQGTQVFSRGSKMGEHWGRVGCIPSLTPQTVFTSESRQLVCKGPVIA